MLRNGNPCNWSRGRSLRHGNGSLYKTRHRDAGRVSDVFVGILCDNIRHHRSPKGLRFSSHSFLLTSQHNAIPPMVRKLPLVGQMVPKTLVVTRHSCSFCSTSSAAEAPAAGEAVIGMRDAAARLGGWEGNMAVYLG